MKAIEKASLNLHPEEQTMDPTGLEAALEATAVEVVSKWTEMHDTTESKDKAAGPFRKKKGLR